MTTPPPDPHEAALLAALSELDGSNTRDQRAISSILAAVAGNPALVAAANRVLAYPQAQLELHLQGATVRDHATRADWLGHLVARLSSAVNEVTKSFEGKRRHAPGLQVLAPTPGSVKVIVRAPLPDRTMAQRSIEGTDDTTTESRALTFVTSLLRMAEDPGDQREGESPIVAAAERISPVARQRIRSVAKTVVDADWVVEGTLTQRGLELEQINLNSPAASRLYKELNRSVTETASEILQGTIDGQRHSRSTMWFVPLGGRPFEAAVTDPELMQLVTEYSVDPGMILRCEFRVVLSIPAGSHEASSRSRELISVGPVPPQEVLPTMRDLGNGPNMIRFRPPPELGPGPAHD